MGSSSRQLEVSTDDQTPHKWSVSLGEEVFKRFFALEGGSSSNPTAHKVFSEGSLFSPLLFGKYFDPCDAFPLWEFESDALLAGLRSSGRTAVDWSQTDDAYVLKADLPGSGKPTIGVYVEKGRIVEISGQWNPHHHPNAKDWRTGHWWLHGFVRRLELPEDADWKRTQAFLISTTTNGNDTFLLLELRIPKCSMSDLGSKSSPSSN